MAQFLAHGWSICLELNYGIKPSTITNCKICPTCSVSSPSLMGRSIIASRPTHSLEKPTNEVRDLFKSFLIKLSYSSLNCERTSVELPPLTSTHLILVAPIVRGSTRALLCCWRWAWASSSVKPMVWLNSLITIAWIPPCFSLWTFCVRAFLFFSKGLPRWFPMDCWNFFRYSQWIRDLISS